MMYFHPQMDLAYSQPSFGASHVRVTLVIGSHTLNWHSDGGVKLLATDHGIPHEQ
jgi:hypothetical protein